MNSSEPSPGSPDPVASQTERLSRSERRARAATDVLRTLLRDLYVDRYGAAAPEGSELDVTLRLRAQPARNWELSFDPPVVDQILSQMAEAQADWEVYRKGRVYCYRCATSGCEHAAPPSPLSVFAGYEPMGRPEWHDLVQAFIEARDPRVDQLFTKGSCALALVQLGSQLKGRQLAAFGKSSKTYAVLGQVVAGYFGRGDGRIAVTFQVAEARGTDGRLRLHLNTIARLPDGAALDDLLASGWEPAMHRARAVAARALDDLERQAQLAREGGRTDNIREALRHVPALLRRLCDSLERGDRQAKRRTRHVEERREDRRPVHKALDDARGAPPEAIFFDEKTAAMIACGDQGRAHVFNSEGRHVTSFVIRPDAIQLRLRTKRWRPASPDEIQRLKWSMRGGTATERMSPNESAIDQAP
ncbi:MAG: hypothetical protein V1929_10280 [bacterium]